MVRAARVAAKWSLRQLARAARYSPSQLSRVERGLAPPPAPGHRLYATLATECGAPLGELVELARAERAFMVEGAAWHRTR